MRTAKTTDSSQESPRNYPNVTHQYGEIGISAVAAAMRYQTEPRSSDRARIYSDRED